MMSPSPVSTWASPMVAMTLVVGVSDVGMSSVAANEKTPLMLPLTSPARQTGIVDVDVQSGPVRSGP